MANHTLFECPHWAGHRDDLEDLLGLKFVDLPDIVEGLDTTVGYGDHGISGPQHDTPVRRAWVAREDNNGRDFGRPAKPTNSIEQ